MTATDSSLNESLPAHVPILLIYDVGEGGGGMSA